MVSTVSAVIIDSVTVKDLVDTYTHIMKTFFIRPGPPPQFLVDLDPSFMEENKQLILDFSNTKNKREIELLIEALKESLKAFNQEVGKLEIKNLIIAHLKYLSGVGEKPEIDPLKLSKHVIVPVKVKKRRLRGTVWEKKYLYKPTPEEARRLAGKITVDDEFYEWLNAIIRRILVFKPAEDGRLIVLVNGEQLVFPCINGLALLERLWLRKEQVDLALKCLRRVISCLSDRLRVDFKVERDVIMASLKGRVGDVVDVDGAGGLDLIGHLYYAPSESLLTINVIVKSERAVSVTSHDVRNELNNLNNICATIKSLVSITAGKYMSAYNEAREVISVLEKSGYKLDVSSPLLITDFSFTAEKGIITATVSKHGTLYDASITVFYGYPGARKLALTIASLLGDHENLTVDVQNDDIVYLTLVNMPNIDELPSMLGKVEEGIAITRKWVEEVLSGRSRRKSLTDEEAIAVYLLDKAGYIDRELLVDSSEAYIKARVIGILRRNGVKRSEYPTAETIIRDLVKSGLVRIDKSIFVNEVDIREIITRLNPKLGKEDIDLVVRILTEALKLIVKDPILYSKDALLRRVKVTGGRY